MDRLNGKTAVVTGAASGIGKAIAELYAKEGANVVLADYNSEGAETAANEIRENGGEAKAISVDVSKREDVEKMIDFAISEYETIDILVNNAGIMDGFQPAGEITDELWERVFAVNVNGVMYATRKTLPIFLKNETGVIINVASTGGLNGAHAGATYTASKHAVIGFTKNTAFMYAKKGIRVNAIAPGGVTTNIGDTMKNMSEFGLERTGLTHAHGLAPRIGESEEIANIALFLASDDSSLINGVTITADAGWTSAF